MSRLFLGNVAYNLTEKQLIDGCAQLGVAVTSATIAVDKQTGKPRGFAFVEVVDADVEDALRTLQDARVGGRPLRVERANRQEDAGGRRGGNGGGGGGDYGDRNGRRSDSPSRNRDEEPWREERRRARR